MAKPVIFWRDGYDRGMSGHWVRAASLNQVIPQWIAEGIRVAGIMLDPESGNNINVLVVRDDMAQADAQVDPQETPDDV